jgi:hypothetical protein
LAGHGDDDYVEASPEWLEANKERIEKAQAERKEFYRKAMERYKTKR